MTAEKLAPSKSLRRGIAAGVAVAGGDVEHLHSARQLDEELGVTLQVMDAPGVVAGKARHRLDALPVRDGHELALAGAVLAQHLHAERLLHQRLDAVLVEIGGVFIGLGGRGAAAPDAGDRWAHTVCGRGHGNSLSAIRRRASSPRCYRMPLSSS